MSRKDVTDVQVCEAYAKAKSVRFDRWPYDILAEMTGQPVKVCRRAMERACEREYIEYGTSLRTGWVTEKGKALLADHRIEIPKPFDPEEFLRQTAGQTPIPAHAVFRTVK